MHPMMITGRGSGSVAASTKGKARRSIHFMSLCRLSRLLPVAIVCAAQLGGSIPVQADPVPQTMNGVPLLPIPTYNEVGLPAFTMPTGTPTVTDPNTPLPPNTGGDGSGDGSDSVAMATMMSRSWGAAAEANAQSLGVNATALAATCVIESNCENVGGTGTINGAFQMSNGTYNEAMAAALQQNPSLAANIVSGLAGKMDPATESIASAEYLRQGALALQSSGFASNPTVLDVRGFYQFGPGNASTVAQAPNSAILSNTVSLTPEQYQANGITPGVTTIGQWRASITGKIGQTAAQAPVLVSSS